MTASMESPLDGALMLVFQKMERRTIALWKGDEAEAIREYELLKLATADYHQLRAETDAASVRAHDRTIAIGHAVEQTELPLHGWVHRWASLTEDARRMERERWQERLLPVVKSMAEIAAGDGITASDVISRGITDGILIGERAFLTLHPRVYAFVGHWLHKLARDGILEQKTIAAEGGGQIRVRRRSERVVSKGNLNDVFVAGGSL